MASGNQRFDEYFEKTFGRTPRREDERSKELVARIGRDLRIAKRTVQYWILSGCSRPDRSDNLGDYPNYG
jgi:hypothetical protein